MQTAPLLLTGATGFLGAYVAGELRRRGLAFVTAGRAGDVVVDLEQPTSLAACLAQVRPAQVLHVAAMAAMGACQQQPRRAASINVEATATLAALAGRLIFVSTDLVFDGQAAPYRAAAEPTPLSVYGQTKATAEARVLDHGGLVVRLPLLFGRSLDARRGATDMIRAAEQTTTLFTNEFRTPLHAADAASALVDLVLAKDRRGVVHCAGGERVSRWELATRFAVLTGVSLARCQPGLCQDPLRPRDVSLVSDIKIGRSLDAALRES